MTTPTVATPHWTAVCAVQDILPNTGVCARVAERHIAIFRTSAEQWFAIDNIDPRTQASVLARGLIGNLGERLVVASPLYKQHFDLHTGECLEAPQQSVRTYPVRTEGGQVLVQAS